MNIAELTPEKLRKAAKIKEKIARLQNELLQILGDAGAGAGAGKTRRKMSAAGRARIAAAARKRWAQYKAAKKK